MCPSPPDSSALPPLTDTFAVLVITGAFDLQPEDVHLVTFCVTGKKMFLGFESCFPEIKGLGGFLGFFSVL